jgi:hypothetical protein
MTGKEPLPPQVFRVGTSRGEGLRVALPSNGPYRKGELVSWKANPDGTLTLRKIRLVLE